MRSPNMNHRAQLLAKVHVAAKQTGLDEGVYRALLARVTGRSSARELTNEQLVAVLDEFRRLGWQARASDSSRAKPGGKPQARLIWALWQRMAEAGLLAHPDRRSLRAFVRKQTGVSDPEWLSVEQASAVIEALKAWSKRGSKTGTVTT